MPESVDDFAALYELLANLDGDTGARDLLDALAESERACLRSEINSAGDQHLYDMEALGLANSPHFFSAFCMEPGRGADIVVALVEASVGGLPDETESCIRAEVTESYKYSSGRFSYGPPYQDCLNREQLVELSVSELAWGFGEVSEADGECMRQAVAASFGAAERLGSGNPQHSLGIAITFQLAATFGCLSVEQIAALDGVEDAADIALIECMRYLFTEQFPRLYNDVGAKMFGDDIDLSQKELDVVESLWDSFDECETDPPVYPTPDAPGPTLRPGILTELRSISIDENTSVGSVIALLHADGSACLRDKLGGRLYSETAYERFLAMPAVKLTGIPISLWDCFGEEVWANVTAQVIVASAEIQDAGVETCLLKEFAEFGDTGQGHYNLPAWRLEKPYFRCLTEENYQKLAIAQLAASVGELSAESESCAREIAADGFNIARRIDRNIRHLSAVFDTTAYHLCLSDAQFDEFYQIVASQDGVNLRTYHRDCMRTVYDESVAKLRAEDDESAWAKGESPALDEFWDARIGCKVQP